MQLSYVSKNNARGVIKGIIVSPLTRRGNHHHFAFRSMETCVSVCVNYLDVLGWRVWFVYLLGLVINPHQHRLWAKTIFVYSSTHINGSAQDYSKYCSLAMELLQSSNNPLIWCIFSCDQAALKLLFPSVCSSVWDTFLTMFLSSYYHEIFRSDYQWQAWCPCKRSRSEVKGQGHRGHYSI